MSLRILNVPVTDFQQNCRIVADSDTNDAFVVDPGGDAELILQTISQEGLNLKEVWLTHSHLDHCGGVQDLLDAQDCPLIGHPGEKEFRSRVQEICLSYGLPVEGMKNCPEPTQYIEGGETLTFGEHSFEVRFCPGHSPGHVIFYCAAEGFLLAGDTLFEGSIGRTDLPGGDHQQLLSKIQSEIYSLPEETRVLPGHGPDTTVGREKESNPFVGASA